MGFPASALYPAETENCWAFKEQHRRASPEILLRNPTANNHRSLFLSSRGQKYFHRGRTTDFFESTNCAFINALIQRGAECGQDVANRFNCFSKRAEAVGLIPKGSRNTGAVRPRWQVWRRKFRSCSSKFPARNVEWRNFA